MRRAVGHTSILWLSEASVHLDTEIECNWLVAIYIVDDLTKKNIKCSERACSLVVAVTLVAPQLLGSTPVGEDLNRPGLKKAPRRLFRVICVTTVVGYSVIHVGHTSWAPCGGHFSTGTRRDSSQCKTVGAVFPPPAEFFYNSR